MGMIKAGFLTADIPYLEDGDVKMVESLAITKYVARKLKCTATSEQDMLTQDQAESVVNCFVERIVELRWMPETEETKQEQEDFKKSIYKKLEPMQQLIKKNGDRWICGAKLTWVDFFLACAFSLAKELVPTVEDQLFGLRDHLARLRENEGFKAYYDSCSFDLPPLMWEVPRRVLFKDEGTEGGIYKPRFK